VKTFFCKLIPPRPSFAQDLTPAEAAVMQQHAAYWNDRLAKGEVVTFGMVAASDGAFGIGVIEVADDGAARALTDGDPAARSGLGFRWELHLMPRGAAHR
jgi:uncharacterized protein YciI